MKLSNAEKQAYKTFVRDCGAVCWRCGRTPRYRPAWWSLPFLIERSHVVNHPRVESRKCCVLLCSLCHRIQHGDTFKYDLTNHGYFPLCTRLSLTLEQCLQMKFERDREFWEPEFLAACSVKRELVLSICREIQKGTP